MTLSAAERLDRFAAALAADTGLSVGASRLWAQAEVGPYNNLGIMAAPGVPRQYATPEAGAAAAAQLINSSPLYAGIRATVGKDQGSQLRAIAQSPWHLGPSGLRAAGGTDPYYARIFGLGSSSSAPAPASPPWQAPTITPGMSAQDRAGVYVTRLEHAASLGPLSPLQQAELAQYREVATHPSVAASTPASLPPLAAPAAFAGVPVSQGVAAGLAPLGPSQAGTGAVTPAPVSASFDPLGLAVMAAGAALAIALVKGRAPSGD